VLRLNPSFRPGAEEFLYAPVSKAFDHSYSVTLRVTSSQSNRSKGSSSYQNLRHHPKSASHRRGSQSLGLTAPSRTNCYIVPRKVIPHSQFHWLFIEPAISHSSKSCPL
jgi:hypothetical protein